MFGSLNPPTFLFAQIADLGLAMRLGKDGAVDFSGPGGGGGCLGTRGYAAPEHSVRGQVRKDKKGTPLSESNPARGRPWLRNDNTPADAHSPYSCSDTQNFPVI